ncbi:MAG: hypothetical protein ACLS8D_06235 [Clostridioides difficile]
MLNRLHGNILPAIPSLIILDGDMLPKIQLEMDVHTCLLIPVLVVWEDYSWKRH